MKTEILAKLGEKGLQPAAALNAALAANDRVKFVFSLLQFALAHTKNPEQTAPALRRERVACGIDAPDLDNAAAGARMAGTACHVPGTAKILVRLAEDMRVMASPVLADKPDGFGARLEKLLADLPKAENDLLAPDVISAITLAERGGADSLRETWSSICTSGSTPCRPPWPKRGLNGAAAYNLNESDRPCSVSGVHGRSQPHREAEVYASGSGDHGDARRRTARYPERYRHD